MPARRQAGTVRREAGRQAGRQAITGRNAVDQANFECSVYNISNGQWDDRSTASVHHLDVPPGDVYSACYVCSALS